MINVCFTRDGENTRLQMTGHSDFKANGQLIVCSAVSAIFYTLLGYLKNTYKDKLTINSIESGFADIECRDCDTEPFRMACIGLLQISECFPGQISIQNKIWDSAFCKGNTAKKKG